MTGGTNPHCVVIVICTVDGLRQPSAGLSVPLSGLDGGLGDDVVVVAG